MWVMPVALPIGLTTHKQRGKMPKPQPKGVWTEYVGDMHGGHVELFVDGKSVKQFYNEEADEFAAGVIKDYRMALEGRRQRDAVLKAERRAEGYV